MILKYIMGFSICLLLITPHQTKSHFVHMLEGLAGTELALNAGALLFILLTKRLNLDQRTYYILNLTINSVGAYVCLTQAYNGFYTHEYGCVYGLPTPPFRFPDLKIPPIKIFGAMQH